MATIHDALDKHLPTISPDDPIPRPAGSCEAGPMRYVVIGAGAIGGTIGGRLAEAGREVVLVARGAHLAALRKSGLRLDDPERSRTLRLPAVGGVGEVGWRTGDVALLCTKTQDTEAVLDALRAAAPDVPVVCAQNGVANERFAAARFAAVQAMCVMLPAEHIAPCDPSMTACSLGPSAPKEQRLAALTLVRAPWWRCASRLARRGAGR